MYLGRRVRVTGEGDRIYHHGGQSYVLNQASVGLLASKIDEDASQPHTRRYWEDFDCENPPLKERHMMKSILSGNRGRKVEGVKSGS